MQQVVYLIVALAVAAAILSIAVAMKAVLPPPEAPLEHAEALVYVKVRPLNGSYWLGVHAPYGDVEVSQVRVGNATYVLYTTAPVGRDTWLNASGRPITARCGDSVEVVTARGSAVRSLAFTVQCPASERRVEMVAVTGKYFEAVAKYVLGFNETKIIAYLKDPATVVVKNVSPEPLLLTVNQFPKMGYEYGRWTWPNKIYGWIDIPGVGLVPSNSPFSIPGDVRCIWIYHNTWRGTTTVQFLTYSELGRYVGPAYCRLGMATPQLPPLMYSGSSELPPMTKPGLAPNYDWMPCLLMPNQTIELPLGDYVFSVYPAELYPYFSNSTALIYTAGIAPWRVVGVAVTNDGAVQWLAPGLQVKSAAVPFNGTVTLFGGLKANITTLAGGAIASIYVDPVIENSNYKVDVETGLGRRCVVVRNYDVHNVNGFGQPVSWWCTSCTDRDLFYLRLGLTTVGCGDGVGVWSVYINATYEVCTVFGCYRTNKPVPKPYPVKISDAPAYYIYVNNTLVSTCAMDMCKSGVVTLYYYSLAPYAYNYLLVYAGGPRQTAGGLCGHSKISLYKLDRDWTSYELVSTDEKGWPCPDYGRGGSGGGGGPWYKIVRVNARKVGLVGCSSGRCTWAMEYDTYAVYSDGTRQYLGTNRLYGTIQTGNGQIYVVDKDDPSIACPATNATTVGGYLTCSSNSK